MNRVRLLSIGALVAAAVVLFLVFAVSPGPDKPKKADTITFKVDGPDRDRAPDDLVKAGGEAPEVLDLAQADPQRYDLDPEGLRGKDPTSEGTVSGPLASPEWPGCLTRFTPVNFSSRTAPVRGFALHFTAGLNRPGWSDMNGLAAYASSRAAGVSWHFLIDDEGHCYYQVPVSKKAWTIGNLNSQTINVEMIGTGREATYGGKAGLRKLAMVVKRAASIYHFPVRLGAVSSCSVTRSGIITHWMGGACAGGHVDVKPYDIAQIVKQIAASGTKPVTAADVATCWKLNSWRNAGRPAGGAWERNSVSRKAALSKRGVVCTTRGPVRK